VCAASLDRCDAIPGPVVTPPELEIGVGRRAKFSATGENVTFDLQNSLIAGSITPDGTYFAPPSPGEFELIVRSSFGARRVKITVRELRLSMLAGQHGGPSDFPIDGVGDTARVSGPRNGVMSSGKLWFLDGFQSLASPFTAALRRFDPVTRATTTLLVSEMPGGAQVDGPLNVATFGSIFSLASGGPHSLLILDEGAIRELDTDTLTVSTVRRYGLNSTALLQGADQLLVRGNVVYGVDPRRHVIIKWVRGTDTDEVLAGALDMPGTADGMGSAARFSGPTSLTTEGDNLFVLDDSGRAVRWITLDGNVTTPAELNRPNTVYTAIAGIPVGFRQSGFPSRQLLMVTSDGSVLVNNQGFFDSRVFASSITMESSFTALATTSDAIRRYDLRAGIPEVVAGRAGVPRGRDDGQGQDARLAFFSGHFTVFGDTAWFCEETTGRIRTVNRAGLVKTVFERDDETPFPNACGSIAVDDTWLYMLAWRQGTDNVLRRAPRFGGTWEEGRTPVQLEGFLGRLDDGRLVTVASNSVGFIDPATFSKTAEVHLIPGAFDVDPAGGIIARSSDGRLQRFDLATSTWAELGPAIDPRFGSWVHFANGKLYSFGGGSGPDERVPMIFELDPAVKAWAPMVGKLRTGAVRPGPLSSALLHQPGWIDAFDNGDLLVSDRAENVFLVIE
jgi:hypothetical protein